MCLEFIFILGKQDKLCFFFPSQKLSQLRNILVRKPAGKMQSHALRSSRKERMSFKCLHVNQTGRKLIILLSFSGGNNIIFCPLWRKFQTPSRQYMLPMLGEHNLLVLAGSTLTRWSSLTPTGCMAQGSLFCQRTKCTTWTDSLTGHNT